MSGTNPFDLSGELPVITGGGTGIGFGIAQCMVRAGAGVVLVEWIRSELLEKTVDADPERKRRVLSRTPMGRFGGAEDVGWAEAYRALRAFALTMACGGTRLPRALCLQSGKWNIAPSADVCYLGNNSFLLRA